MEKVKTFLADISDLLNEKNYQKIYEKVPAFRQEKADRLKHREDQAQSVGAWYLWMKIQERHKIPQDAGQSFNLSHSGKYVLCSAGVSGERVGCDIECMRKYHCLLYTSCEKQNYYLNGTQVKWKNVSLGCYLQRGR